MRIMIAYTCSVISAFTLAFFIDFVDLAVGDCSIAATAKAIGFGFPIGGVIGIFIYKALSHQFRKINVLGMFLGLVLSTAAAVGGLFLMDIFGSFVGLLFALLFSCLCALLGYEVVDRIAIRLRRTDRT